MPQPQLHGKICVVTGAGGALCSVMAAALAEAGAHVACVDLNLEAADRVARGISAAGASASAHFCDVTSPDSVEAVHQEIRSRHGPADVLLNGAGGAARGADVAESHRAAVEDPRLRSFLDLDIEAFSKTVDLNLASVVTVSKCFAADMVGRQGCSIINIASASSYRALTKVVAYSAAKAAVFNFTQWLSVHFAASGIRVNAIAPGFFLTEGNRHLLRREDGSLSPRGEKVLAHTPMGRFGDPGDLVGTVIWLADAGQSGFVTGCCVPVDGGFLAYAGV